MFSRGTTQLARLARRSPLRSFSTSQVAGKDLVQDLYINELKAYKAPPQAKDAHVGVVKAYSAPKSPSAPAAPTDLASELSSYDSTEPTLASSAPAAGAAPAADETGADAKAFLAFLEQDLPKPEQHHH